MSKSAIVKLLIIAGACVNAIAFAALVAESGLRFPSPNVASQPRYLALILVPTSVALLGFKYRFGRISRIAVASWFALLTGYVVMDQFNFLVEYTIWLHRGLPSSGTPPWEIEYGSGGSFIDEWR